MRKSILFVPVCFLALLASGAACKSSAGITTTAASPAASTSSSVPTTTQATTSARPTATTLPPTSSPRPNSTTAQTSTSTSISTLAPTTTSPAAAMFLQVTSPADESIVEDPALTITGKTLPGAVVSINEVTTDADATGSFSLQVALDEGPNVFDITASDADGDSTTTQIVVSYAP